MDRVRSAARDERDLRAGGAAGVGVGVGRGDAELIDRLTCGAQGTVEGIAEDLIVVVYAVQGEVGLVLARAVDDACPCVLVEAAALGSTVERKYARLQGKEVGDVVGQVGQVLHLRTVEGLAQRGVRAIDRCQRAFDVDDLTRPGTEPEAEFERCGDEQLDLLVDLIEARRGDLDRVAARRKLLEREFTLGRSVLALLGS